ncbi:MAG TPA: diguanylate cyclase [Bryobacteraceae bacterium]|jgi:diguanylate cyclase (GGDEF)-like protein|nr:diguanylate cyclase [Bryobacteraceae bacterium]
MKILAAEDNPLFQSVLRTILTKWGYDATIVRDGVEAWRALQSQDSPRLAILDWMMPGMDGLEVCRRVRAAKREPYVYILLLTGRAESKDLVEGMDAGADDYLTKPLNTHELRVRLRAGRRILDLQEELLQAREALREQATHDSLTGLFNRASILETLHNELSRARRESQPVALLMVDLDRFKQINDTCGHLAGDGVLREAARRMKSAVRRYDAVGRYGGEEFLIVLPGCAADAARAQAERVREALADGTFAAGDQSLAVTCSIGVSCRTRPFLSDTDPLVREADLALYAAKDRGRNRVEAHPQPSDLHAFGLQDLPGLAMAIDR